MPLKMTLEDVRNKPTDSGAIWLEDSSGKSGWALKCESAIKGWTTFALSYNYGTIISFDEGAYGEKWCCWTSKPSEEQGGVVKLDD